jgi:23S rRNA (cytidine1920-2'-O)/16S rRNA (cytidine1409-2'-O)-methyltransferase
VDVGHGQLDAVLRADPRVRVLEGFDARRLTVADVPGPVAAITADVSFISLPKVLPAALRLATPGAWLVALVKPQFEVGREGVGKGGIVRDPALRAEAVARVRAFLEDAGWRVAGETPSPITGGDGNQEFLIGADRP